MTTLTIFVKVSDDQTVSADITASTTPEELRQQLEAEGVAVDGMRFLFEGQEVSETMPVVSCGVSSDGELSTEVNTDGFAKFGNIFGIFNHDRSSRMDVGVYAIKGNSHTADDTPTSRFVITKNDESSGTFLKEDKPFSLVTEDGQHLMCINPPAYKTKIPPTHKSWATVLRIIPLKSKSKEFIRFGDTVRVVTVEQDGTFCADAGSDILMQQIPASMLKGRRAADIGAVMTLGKA
eukprot:TRINITY_DN4959_c0_g1_i1.p1 TRINITY_DN4959_c0_g1~~TRINITY_DN4959_c0_g1_i1.p1  ORF type:complete len:236 (+),score=57.19 TRINITY_DN4959_c0_g1_i1:50-757(+)